MITFTVEVEDTKGRRLRTFHDIPAQTRKEAINKVKSELVFTAERENKDCADKAERPEIPQHSNR